MNNLTTTLNSWGIHTKEHGEHHHTTHGRVQIDCPRCSPQSGKFRLGIHLEKMTSNCWVCGYVPLTEAIKEITNLPWKEIREQLDAIITKPEIKQKKTHKLILPKGLGPLLPPHKHYLESRGFSPKKIELLWKIQGLGLVPDLSWRIWIPITRNEKTISWTTRGISKNLKATRYIAAREDQEVFPAKNTLYGQENTNHTVIVVEGPTDVWRIGPGAVATMGVSYTKTQIKLIADYPTRVICFDNEPLAQKKARQLCSVLEPYPGTTYLVTLDSPDPGSASKKEITLLRRSFLD